MSAIDTDKLLGAFKNAMCSEIEISPRGMDSYVVHVPFTFDDGDHYVVMLAKEEDRWVLTDGGHTFMHLSYKLPEFDEGKRREVIERVLTSFQIENMDGELKLALDPERPGDALFSYVQAITKVTDVSFLNREVVRSTFLEDFNAVTQQVAAGRKLELDYHHPVRDEAGLYPVSARIEGNGHPQVLLFAIGTDDHCQRATITLLNWDKWGEKYRSIAVFPGPHCDWETSLGSFFRRRGETVLDLVSGQGTLAERPE